MDFTEDLITAEELNYQVEALNKLLR